MKATISSLSTGTTRIQIDILPEDVVLHILNKANLHDTLTRLCRQACAAIKGTSEVVDMRIEKQVKPIVKLDPSPMNVVIRRGQRLSSEVLETLAASSPPMHCFDCAAPTHKRDGHYCSTDGKWK